MCNPTLGKQLKLSAGEIALHFVEELIVGATLNNCRKKFEQITHFENIIDSCETKAAIFVRQSCEFFDYAVSAFRPKLHRCAIQPTKDTMMLFAPPTSTRCLQRNPGTPPSRSRQSPSRSARSK